LKYFLIFTTLILNIVVNQFFYGFYDP
jgi:hypothetical protein